MVVEDRIEKEKARRKAEQEAEELRAAIKVIYCCLNRRQRKYGQASR